MCLDPTFQTVPAEMAAIEMIGYRVVKLRNGKPGAVYQGSLEILRMNKWMNERNYRMESEKLEDRITVENYDIKSFVPLPFFTYYPKGFHIFLKKSAAYKWAYGRRRDYRRSSKNRLAKVIVKGVHTIGTQQGNQVIVATHMKILEVYP
jgi:hypothetical protein